MVRLNALKLHACKTVQKLILVQVKFVYHVFRTMAFTVDLVPLHHQVIIPSYKFVCNQMCGNITVWGVDANPGGRNNQPQTEGGTPKSAAMPYTLDLQVWRPSPTVDDSTGTGCYSLVGNNRFTSISLSDRVARVTPSPQDYIQFQPGDVFGFYVEEARGANNGVVVLDEYIEPRFTNNLVWYASIAPSMATSLNGDCPYSVGSNGVLNTLTRAAPVISISTGMNSVDDCYNKFKSLH